MKKLPWKDIKEELANQRGGPPMRKAGDFWSDFKARVRLHPRLQPEPARAFPPVARWALATACATIVVSWLFLAGVPGRAAPEKSRINSVEVVASHSAVLIMEDEPSDSTILWVVDMDIDNGGNT
jgi:hypothetical protein